MGKQPLLLDLFCGAGGAGVGYHRAGFRVIGVDINPQPNYPFDFVQMDALEFLERNGRQFDYIHASPPCQGYSHMTRTAGTQDKHPRLIAELKALLKTSGKPYVIENVAGAKRELDDPIMLCGVMFGLLVIRHRYFEVSEAIQQPYHPRHERVTVNAGRRPDREKNYHCVVGNFPDYEFARQAMGIDWTGPRRELAQAIPPAYTEYIGGNLLSGKRRLVQLSLLDAIGIM